MGNNWLKIEKDGDSVILERCSQEATGEIVIPEGVTKIGCSAFRGCCGLTSVKIPNSVTSIELMAFEGCSGLTSIVITASVTSIGRWAFSDCSRLSIIEVSPDNKIFDSREQCNAIIKSEDNELIVACKGTRLPSSVQKIELYAFRDIDISSIIVSENNKVFKEAFVDAILLAILERINKKHNEGSLEILQLYSMLDYPPMHTQYERLVIDKAYRIVEKTQHLVAQGVLRLESSSWGSIEISDEKHIGTQPGFEDMYPKSVGWNNFGGPTYSINFSKKGIEMEAGFCDQDLGCSGDTMDTSFRWQYRTFSFVPTCDDDATLKQMITPFEVWIIVKFARMLQQDFMHDIINRAADVFLDRFLENLKDE